MVDYDFDDFDAGREPARAAYTRSVEAQHRPAPPPVDRAPALRDRIAAAAAALPGRVGRVEIDGRSFWIKRPAPPRSPWRYRALNAVTTLLGVPALGSPSHPQGRALLALEARRINELAAQGVPVPAVVASGPDWLALASAGDRSLDAALRATPDPAERAALWCRGLDGIAAAHAAGGCLSQCFARNMVLDAAGRISFIDFEEDPREVHSLARAQARDWAFYLHSTAWLVADAPARHAMFAQRLAAESPAVQTETRHLMQRLRWLAALPTGTGLGPDVAHTRAAGEFIRAALAPAAQTQPA